MFCLSLWFNLPTLIRVELTLVDAIQIVKRVLNIVMTSQLLPPPTEPIINNSPISFFIVKPSEGIAPLTISLDAIDSFDLDGTITTCGQFQMVKRLQEKPQV